MARVERRRTPLPKARDVRLRLRGPIELYTWPTPNGQKVSIMLEECRLPYRVIAVNIACGDQFKPAFLKISPNNRIPAIVDPDGPGGRPISVFESGAILQYLGRKSGKFYPSGERQRAEVEQWLFWQMANLGPKAGEANHFRRYAAGAPQQYAIDRFGNELNRLFGVMNRRLADRDYLAGGYSIADMACVGWIRLFERQAGKDQAGKEQAGKERADKHRANELDGFRHLKRWLARVRARPAVQRGMSIRIEEASQVDVRDPKVRAVLFGQRAL